MLLAVRRRCSPSLVRSAVVFLLCSSIAAAGVHAQGGASISGKISDAQGGVLPGVTLTLRNVDSGVVREGVSEVDGNYRFGALPPGVYDLKAEMPAFAPVEFKGQSLTIGLEVRQDISMALQGVEEAITVSARSPVVETSRSEVAQVVTQQQIDSLPVNTRQTLTLALLVPGTSTDESRPRRVSVSVGAGGDVKSSSFIVDGVSNQQTTSGDPRQDFPQGAIREFKVNVSQAKAEFGGTTGGVVTLVTKSGTNLVTGEAFEYFRDKSLNRMNLFEQQRHDELGAPKPDFRRHQFGATLGGPIVRDRAHFLVAAISPRRTTSSPSTPESRSSTRRSRAHCPTTSTAACSSRDSMAKSMAPRTSSCAGRGNATSTCARAAVATRRTRPDRASSSAGTPWSWAIRGYCPPSCSTSSGSSGRRSPS